MVAQQGERRRISGRVWYIYVLLPSKGRKKGNAVIKRGKLHVFTRRGEERRL